MFSPPCIVLITGIMASGKSTVAQALAERFDRGVHLRGDHFRRMIVAGRTEMTPESSEEALEQLRLRYRLATDAARSYCDAGFVVVYQDVVIGPMLNEVIGFLSGNHPLHLIVLCPSPTAIERREAERPKTAYGAWSADRMDRELRASTPKVGLWLDTSDLSIKQTVDAIIARSADSRI